MPVIRSMHVPHANTRRSFLLTVLCITAAVAACGDASPVAPADGSLSISVSGLPATAAPSLRVTGPAGYARTFASGATLTALTPGTYHVSAAEVRADDDRFGAARPTLTVVVPARGNTSVDVPYTILTGSLALGSSGLPDSSRAEATLVGPDGTARIVTLPSAVAGLVSGRWTVFPFPVVVAGQTYMPAAEHLEIEIVAGVASPPATIAYAVTTGSVTVDVSGLPDGAAAAITLVGPSGTTRAISATGIHGGLEPGAYVITASTVEREGITYSPGQASQDVVVAAGQNVARSVVYTKVTPVPKPPAAGTLNLTIDGMHVQQVVQTYAGTVPLVAGRSGLLRVFGRASAANTAAPAVRLRLYQGGTLASTVTIAATAASVPTVVAEGVLSASWNYVIPPALMQPGLRVLAEIDPDGAVPESSEHDNSYPASGAPLALDVRAVPAFSLRFVPVVQSATGLQGGVTTANASQFLAEARALFPLGTIDVDVRAPFTTSAPALQSGDGNRAWGQILSEINALRVAEGGGRFYYGVVRVPYFSGVAGLGYVPGRAAVGWDFLPSASEVMAHELGHNFGRLHAPCGGAGGADPAFPHSGGTIGAYGYDATAGTLKAPAATDLMGYCNNAWISDYTYTGILAHRAASPFAASAALAGDHRQKGLLVWGRIQGGEVILEPSYEVDAAPSLPQRPGRHRIEAFGSLGERLLDLSFDGDVPADAPGQAAQHFAFVVPLSAMRNTPPARIRLSAAGRRTERTAMASIATADEEPVARRLEGGQVQLSWKGDAIRGVLVRDARSGEILAFGRDGSATVRSAGSELDLSISDGVGSATRRVRVTARAGSQDPSSGLR